MVVKLSNGLCIEPCGEMSGKMRWLQKRGSLLVSLQHLVPCSHQLWNKQHGQEEIISLWTWWGTGTDFPKKLWMYHAQKCSSPGWRELWGMWSSEWCPCPWQSLWFLSTQTMLWFYDSINSHCRFYSISIF